MTAVEVAVEVLKRVKTPLCPTKFWDKAVDFGLDKELTNFKGKTPHMSFSAAIYLNLKNNEAKSPLYYTQIKPVKSVGLKEWQDDPNLQKQILQTEVAKAPKEKNFCERDLHPLLVKFVKESEEFDAYAKTIFHENSTKSPKGENRWIHPDIVGVSFEYDGFDENLIKCIPRFNTLPVKIYSFEMKVEINVANLRECYFQAVSNSSFANEGYLVALDIDENDAALMDLIFRLNASFGIGVISLNSEDALANRILAKAKFRKELDLMAMNDLAQKNPDFSKFLKTVSEFDLKNKNRFEKEFDPVLSEEECAKLLDKIQKSK